MGKKDSVCGDSITQAGDGYVSVVQSIIGALLPDMKLEYINTGVSGNKVTDMLERISDDVIARDPDWITVSVGVNDVCMATRAFPSKRSARNTTNWSSACRSRPSQSWRSSPRPL